MNRIVNLAIAAAAALAATPAAAQSVHISADGNYRAVIPYGDLNLASPAGLKTLQGRAKTAANQICGVASGGSLVEMRSISECRETIMSAAQPQLANARQALGSGAVALGADR